MDKAFIDKLAYIYLKDSKVLLTKSIGKDVWYVPGGKRETGESDEEALIREVREELSVELKPETIQRYGVFEAQAHGKPEGTIVRMTCYTAGFTGELLAANEIEEISFLGYKDKPKTAPVDHLIFDDLYNKGLIV